MSEVFFTIIREVLKRSGAFLIIFYYLISISVSYFVISLIQIMHIAVM